MHGRCYAGTGQGVDFIGGGTAGGVLKILDSGVVDFLAAPGNYDCRQPGGYIAQREMQDSFRIRDTCDYVKLLRFLGREYGVRLAGRSVG